MQRIDVTTPEWNNCSKLRRFDKFREGLNLVFFGAIENHLRYACESIKGWYVVDAPVFGIIYIKMPKVVRSCASHMTDWANATTLINESVLSRQYMNYQSLNPVMIVVARLMKHFWSWGHLKFFDPRCHVCIGNTLWKALSPTADNPVAAPQVLN